MYVKWISAITAVVVAVCLTTASSFATVIYQDDFSGGAVGLDGSAPDVAPGAETWVASPAFNADGTQVGQSLGSSATLAFTPSSGGIYTLDASLTGVSGGGDWFGFGFANGQSTAISSNNRFLSGNDVEGRAWLLFRGDATPGQAFLTGSADGVGWDAAFTPTTPGGDVDMRVVLDTTGGAGTWTSTWFAKRPADGSYTQVRAAATLADEDITSIGFSRSAGSVALPGGHIDGVIESISLTVVPEPASLAMVLLGIASLAVTRKR